MEIGFVDVKSNIPSTISNTLDRKASKSENREAVIGGSGLPVLKLGHANSFIKNISLSHINNPQIKAALIERMFRKGTADERDNVTREEDRSPATKGPLRLPIKGTAKLLGHPEWKPGRSFYLDTGIFILDAVYRILNVTHTLSAEGYSTEIEFIYN